MRLFVAVDLDKPARESIAGLQGALKARMERHDRSLRWVRPEDMHLTLAFIEQATETQFAGIADALQRPVDQPRFRCSLGGLGVFPPKGRPRVLFLNVQDGGEPLSALARSVAARLEPVGIPRESRPFRPHLTLARWRDGQGEERRIAEPETGIVARLDVVEVVLYQSELSPRGPSYTRLTASKLT